MVSRNTAFYCCVLARIYTSISLTETRMTDKNKNYFSSIFISFNRKLPFLFQVQHGSLVMGRCQGSTTTLLVSETSGSWRKVDFCWKVEHMMVGTALKTCTGLLHNIYIDSSLCWRERLLYRSESLSLPGLLPK